MSPRKHKSLPLLSERDVDRFWSNVEKSDNPAQCWEWIGGISKTVTGIAYGIFSIRHVNYKAHRIAFHLVNGSIPPGTQVRHDCDNHLCVNPRHLRTGTAKENIADAWDRGRHYRTRQTGNGQRRLTVEISSAAKRRGLNLRQLAAILDIPQQTLNKYYYRQPSYLNLELLARIAEALEVDPRDLIVWTKELN